MGMPSALTIRYPPKPGCADSFFTVSSISDCQGEGDFQSQRAKHGSLGEALRLVVFAFSPAGNRGAQTVRMHSTVDTPRLQEREVKVETQEGVRCEVGGAVSGWSDDHPIRGPRLPATGKPALSQRAHPFRRHIESPCTQRRRQQHPLPARQ